MAVSTTPMSGVETLERASPAGRWRAPSGGSAEATRGCGMSRHGPTTPPAQRDDALTARRGAAATPRYCGDPVGRHTGHEVAGSSGITLPSSSASCSWIRDALLLAQGLRKWRS